MGHHHDHGAETKSPAFGLGVLLNLAFVTVEVAAGIASGSLALLADAGHNLSDVAGLLLAWGASRLGKRRPTERRTYGWRRSSILAAVANATLLLFAVGAITWEAARRFANPAPVAGGVVMAVAGLGVAVNFATALLFVRGRKRDLNVRGAFLHMMADAAVSLGVVLAGLAMRLTGLRWIDPASSLAIAAIIAVGTWGLLRRSTDLALDSVPNEIDPADVRNYLAGLPEISEVHDLHIWAMSTTETALTAHLVRPDGRVDDEWLASVRKTLHDRFGIEHATIQIESRAGHDCCGLSEGETAAGR